MQSKLAPIGISTYSRIHHLQKTVEALKNNLLASQSELFIFSDAPKAGDEEIVNKVRSYIHTITGFKKIHIIERSTNGRVKNNRGGIQDLLDTYGKCIFMEDDNVTAPGFLNFVNKALETYEENEEILSVTGYTPPINIPNSCDQDFFVLSRFRITSYNVCYTKLLRSQKHMDSESFTMRPTHLGSLSKSKVF